MIRTTITTTEGAQAFLRYLHATGRSYHPDDDSQKFCLRPDDRLYRLECC